MDDLISRQAAIDFIDAGRLCNPNEPRWSDNEIVNFLKSRPSAQPEPDTRLYSDGFEDGYKQAIKDTIDALSAAFDDGDGVELNAYWYHKKVLEVVGGVPAADVQEVKHGRWEEVASSFMDITAVVYRCSECGATSLPRYKYCPNCGARMDDLREDGVGAYALDPMIRRLVDSDARMDEEG